MRHELIDGVARGKAVLYICTESSDPVAAAIENVTYAPALNAAPYAGGDGTDSTRQTEFAAIADLAEDGEVAGFPTGPWVPSGGRRDSTFGALSIARCPGCAVSAGPCGQRRRPRCVPSHAGGVPGRRPVPPELLGRPFTFAMAAAVGIGPDVLRGARFWTPVPGVRAATELDDSLEVRCRALALLVGEATFSHLTAARLCDLPVPGRCGPLGLPLDDEPLEVTCAVLPPRISGVRGHYGEVGADVRTLGNGLRVTTGARTWADLAPRLGLDDVVVLGDAVLRHGWAGLVELTAWAARPRRRGAGRMRAAIALLEPRTDSPMETRLRLLIVRAGLPRPAANLDVVVDGAWLARPDLSYPTLRIAIEYDGDHHHRTDRRQWQRDIGRRRVLEDAGWLLVVVTADDVLRRPRETVELIRRAIASRAA